VLPYLVLYGLQVGIPIDIMGTGLALVLLATVCLKPLVSFFADRFPKIRKGLFIINILITAISFGSMAFVDPFGVSASYDQVAIIQAVSGLLNPEQWNSLENCKESCVAVPHNG